MEDVLDVYKLPYNPDIPVLCVDESCKQLLEDVRPVLPARPGDIARQDDEYIRHGVAEIFLGMEPLTGRCEVSVGERRGCKEWAEFIRFLLEDKYPNATKVVFVMDNLNTHALSSLYQCFTPEKARSLAGRMEIHYTPKHGSWLDVAEIGLSVLKSQCLDRRIPDLETMKRVVGAWQERHNSNPRPVQWHFTCEDARVKLLSTYPKI